MKSTIWGLILICVCAYQSPAQITDLKELLLEVENENQDLKVFREQMKAQKLLFQSSNNLSDPQLSGYYLPFGEHSTPDYWEFELTQRVEFPTVYKARSQYIDQRKQKLELEYEALKREKLLEAAYLYYEVVYLSQLRVFYTIQIENAAKALEHSKYLFEKGETGKLAINKAQLANLEPQFKLEELEQKLHERKLSLKFLCGCEEMVPDSFNYGMTLEMEPLDSILQEAMRKHIQLQLAEMDKKIASKSLDLAKTQTWPSLSAGFNYQGVPENNYAGFFAGLSLPLWSQKHKVETNRASFSASEEQFTALQKKLNLELSKDYHSFNVMLNKFLAYRAAFSEIQSEELLRRTYELGELSFLEYYQEVQFYRNAMENVLNIEKELYQLKSKILQYEL